MIFLVNDANILIDLLKLDLLDTFFRLEYDFQVTDLVLDEVLEENVMDITGHLETSTLTRQGFSGAEMGGIGELWETYPVLSLPDCSCIFLAEKLQATLLTGDATLRRIATQRDIPVHGMLWILDEMIASGFMSRTAARNALLKLMEINQRLPLGECKKRLHDWKLETPNREL